MFRVLIADDEKVICEGLKALIDWNDLGFEIIATAKNGLEVLVLSEKYKPHLIITDIKMPKMNGLEAMTELRKQGSDAEILLLTGFAEFEYVRNALEQGSCGYLMKPVDDEELTRQLKKIAQRLKEVEDIKHRQESDYLLKICYGGDENTDKHPRTLLQDDKYTLISIEYVKNAAELTVTSFAELSQWLEFNCPDSADTLLTDVSHLQKTAFACKSWIATVDTGYMLFVNTDQSDLMAPLVKFAEKYEDLRISISDTAASLFTISESFASLESCRYQYFYNNGEKTVLVSENLHHDMTDKYESIDIESVASHIIACRLDEAVAELTKMGEHIRERRYALPIVEAYVNLFITRLALFMNEAFYMGHELYVLGEKLKPALIYMRLDDLLSVLEQTIILVYQTIQNAAKEAEMGIVKDVVFYLKDKYQGKITLKSVSEQFFINSAYLGQLFKRKMGVSFHDYLTQLRMDKAKQLLVTTSKNISDISREVGFDDPNYFSARFGKTEGMTPREFRTKGIQ